MTNRGTTVRCGATLAALTCCVARAAAAQEAEAPPAPQGTENRQAPIYLLWHASGEFGLPGLLGVNVGATGYAPWVPVMVSAGFKQEWGPGPSHLRGERASLMNREFAKTRTLEARAGLYLRSFIVEKTEASYNDFKGSSSDGRTSYYDRYTYAPDLPLLTQRSLYVGYRSRTAPGATACPTDMSLPEDCAENQQRFFMLGLDLLSAMHAAFESKEVGRLHRGVLRDIDVHLLFTPDANDYARKTLVRRVGAELSVTYYGSYFAFGWGVGWDGDLALLSLSIGAGVDHSFGAAAPSMEAIERM